MKKNRDAKLKQMEARGDHEEKSLKNYQEIESRAEHHKSDNVKLVKANEDDFKIPEIVHNHQQSF